nr:2'-5' RNA ligase family protein [Frankia sp. CiP3]
MAVDPLDEAANQQRPGVEVDVIPAKAEQLTAAQSHRERQDEQRFEPIVCGQGQETTRIIGGQRVVFPVGKTWWTDGLRDVTAHQIHPFRDSSGMPPTGAPIWNRSRSRSDRSAPTAAARSYAPPPGNRSPHFGNDSAPVSPRSWDRTAVPDEPAWFKPHISVTYCNADPPAREVIDRLTRLRVTPPISVPVASVDLLELRREGHAYRWTIRHHIDFDSE